MWLTKAHTSQEAPTSTSGRSSLIRDLLEGTKRFSELKKSITNISQKVLTSNLREMEENELLTRKVYPEVPPRVEYTLTDIGYSLKPLLDDMDKWGTWYRNEVI